MVNLVFMNSLEKLTEDQHTLSGQVSISEEHGRWHVLWSEQSSNGKVLQENWYEGTAWEDMLQVFRYRISTKMSEGYLPVLEEVTNQFETPKGREEKLQMVICYSEWNRNDKLYEELRTWRRDLAFKENKAAYFIATNRLLGLISTFVPHTKDELKQIPGFGAHRLENYGDAILAITAKYKQEKSFPLDWVPFEMDRRKFTLWYFQQKQLKLNKESNQQKLKKKLLTMIEEGATISEMSKKLELSDREVIEWIERLDLEGYAIDAVLELEMAQMPDSLLKQAKEAFDKLGDRYLKPVFQRIYGDKVPAELDRNQVYGWLRILRIHYRRQQDAMAVM